MWEKLQWRQHAKRREHYKAFLKRIKQTGWRSPRVFWHLKTEMQIEKFLSASVSGGMMGFKKGVGRTRCEWKMVSGGTSPSGMVPNSGHPYTSTCLHRWVLGAEDGEDKAELSTHEEAKGAAQKLLLMPWALAGNFCEMYHKRQAGESCTCMWPHSGKFPQPQPACKHTQVNERDNEASKYVCVIKLRPCLKVMRGP